MRIYIIFFVLVAARPIHPLENFVEKAKKFLHITKKKKPDSTQPAASAQPINDDHDHALEPLLLQGFEGQASEQEEPASAASADVLIEQPEEDTSAETPVPATTPLIPRAISDKFVKYLFAHSYNPDFAEEDAIRKRCEIVPYDVECIHPAAQRIVFRGTRIIKSAMGQGRDVQLIRDKLKNIRGQVVGIGVQKGANMWLNAASEHAIEPRIKALVLESPSANVNEVIANITYFNYIPGGSFIITKIFQFILGHYDPNGLQPIDAIEHMRNKDLPIFIIASQEDKTIHINHSRRLYIKFKELGFKNVYLIEAFHGHHNEILESESHKLYQATLHKFFRKWGLAFNPKLFLNNIKIKNYQPDIETVQERMENIDFLEQYKTTIVKGIILLFVAYLCNKRFPNFTAKLLSPIKLLFSLFVKSGKRPRKVIYY